MCQVFVLLFFSFSLSLSSPSSLWDFYYSSGCVRCLLKFVAWLEIGFCCSFTRYRHLSLEQNFFFFPWFATRVTTVSLCLCFALTIDLLYIFISTVHFFFNILLSFGFSISFACYVKPRIHSWFYPFFTYQFYV